MTATLINAGEVCGEKLWQVPDVKIWSKLIESKIADVKNASKDKSLLASIGFLAKFVEKNQKWAHIDINGVRIDENGWAKGFGVKLLTEYIGSL